MTDGERNDSGLLIVGGGLHGSLLALTVHAQNPDMTITLVEPGTDRSHTWCFHPQDVPQHLAGTVGPLVVKTWKNYDVEFPENQRCLSGPYSAITSERLRHHLEQVFSASGNLVLIRDRAVEINANEVVLENRGTRRGHWVVDARGGPAPVANCAFQHFLGLEVELEEKHRLTRPRLMDATVAQSGGFRFLYTLPFEDSRLLLEDTVYSEENTFDKEVFRTRIQQYAHENRWSIKRVYREESGSLPLPLYPSSFPSPPAELSSPVRAGYHGGWFHPTTGYSLPLALRFADVFSRHLQQPSSLYKRFALEHQKQFRFACFLNRMMFRMYKPEHQRGVLSRFYTHCLSLLSNAFTRSTSTAPTA